ncbi:hypothetical protein GCM10011508_14640 [Flavobacterium lutivivi]|jgi:hypothetical protein|nr:hypothetical protein GCM10011508_14640 [Flavobacterium lutivivi]
MKKFLLKLALFSVIISIIILYILNKYSGYVDYFYGKVSSPAQTSLIIGDSRSLQGIQPSVIDSALSKKYELPILNFSFTVKQMSYGDAWIKTIKKKVRPETKNGLFILSVHPWVLSEREEDDVLNGKFYEEKMPPNNLHFVNTNPNIEYFFKNYEYFHFKSMIKKISIVHEDGWLEENSTATSDSATLRGWENIQINLYTKFSKKWKKSIFRVKKLSETIDFLKQHGKVVLVRMPVSKEIFDLELSYWRDFNQEITKLAKDKSVEYYDFSLSDDFGFYDGVHLNKKNGKKFTSILCDSISKY